MLLCGIIDELKSAPNNATVTFFFCQATDARINNATAVLRGLLYLLVKQQRSLISHIRESYDDSGRRLFEDANAWVALSEIFEKILGDLCLQSTYLIIDALDECTTDLKLLLDLIVQMSSAYPHVKWIVSSRNWPDIEERLGGGTQKIRMCLELNETSVSTAVRTYIQHKVDQLTELKKYDHRTRDAIRQYLSSNAQDTFLWVALVCQNLANIPRWKALMKLTEFPPGLDALYRRMVDQICNSEDAELCKNLLAVISVVYRPISLEEMMSLVDMPDGVSDTYELEEIIGLCGSFLTLRERTISFVHQSAKDYLVKHANADIFPDGHTEVQQRIVSRSIDSMDQTLRRDIYDLRHPGYHIDKVEFQDPDPLALIRYACVYWVDHLCEIGIDNEALRDDGTINTFFKKHLLHWLEALSLTKNIPKAVSAITKLTSLFAVSYPLKLLNSRKYLFT